MTVRLSRKVIQGNKALMAVLNAPLLFYDIRFAGAKTVTNVTGKVTNDIL